MSKSIKIIIGTSVATTVFWAAGLAALYLSLPGTTAHGLGFMITDSESGAFLVRNIQTQTVTLTVQELV